MAIAFGNTELTELTPKIAVIGVGGAGCNAVNNMISAQLQGVDFIVANTDAQALTNALADNRIQLGVEITQGLGAGAQPKIGEAAAEEALERIDEMLAGCHMAFVTAGMGGGTGTGAAPVIAKRAREKGILTVGVVTKPFQFEGGRRMKIAEAGIQELAGNVDTLIIIPNQNLFRVANEKTTFADAFNMADEVLHSGVRGITDLMVMPGLINLDFADVRTVMSEMGKAMMGTGEADGEARAADAAAAAISNPLLEEASLGGAKGVIINVTGGMDMTLYEVDEAVNMVREQVDPDALIVFGSAFNQELEGKLRVSVVATGIESPGGVSLPTPQPIRKTEAEPAAPVEAAEPNVSAGEGSEVSDVVEEAAVEDLQPATEKIHAEPMEELEAVEAIDVTPAAVEESITPGQTVEEPVAEEIEQVSAPEVLPQEQPAEDDLETRAIRAQEDAFVAEAPMVPKASMNAPMTAPVEEEATHEVAAEAPSVAQHEEPAQETAPAPQKRSLFQLMTSSLRGNDANSAVEAPEAVNDSGATTVEETVQASEAQPSLGGVSAEERPAPASKASTEQLEIPSFLRRQQN